MFVKNHKHVIEKMEEWEPDQLFLFFGFYSRRAKRYRKAVDLAVRLERRDRADDLLRKMLFAANMRDIISYKMAKRAKIKEVIFVNRTRRN